MGYRIERSGEYCSGNAVLERYIMLYWNVTQCCTGTLHNAVLERYTMLYWNVT